MKVIKQTIRDALSPHLPEVLYLLCLSYHSFGRLIIDHLSRPFEKYMSDKTIKFLQSANRDSKGIVISIPVSSKALFKYHLAGEIIEVLNKIIVNENSENFENVSEILNLLTINHMCLGGLENEKETSELIQNLNDEKSLRFKKLIHVQRSCAQLSIRARALPLPKLKPSPPTDESPVLTLCHRLGLYLKPLEKPSSLDKLIKACYQSIEGTYGAHSAVAPK